MVGKALELGNVSVVRDGRHILTSVDLEVSEGESIAIIGPNGSGKTTLVKLLRGDILPFYDEDSPALFRIFGTDRWNLDDIRRHIGVVSADLQNRFRPGTTVREVICSGFFNSTDIYRNHKVTDGMMKSTEGAAVMMGIDDILDRDIECISLGEMRRTLIARAMAIGPRLLVLDEPMAGLDIVMRSKFRRMFDILIENGVSIVLVTHDLSDIPSAVDRIVCMKDGRVYAQGSPDEVLTDATVSELYGESIKVKKDNGVYQMNLVGGVR